MSQTKPEKPANKRIHAGRKSVIVPAAGVLLDAQQMMGPQLHETGLTLTSPEERASAEPSS